MAALHSFDGHSPLTLQCGNCRQFVACCPCCGAAKFTIIDGERPPLTAFDFFYNEKSLNLAADAVKGGADAGGCWALRRRAIAEAWLASSANVKETYEVAAAKRRKELEMNVAAPHPRDGDPKAPSPSSCSVTSASVSVSSESTTATTTATTKPKVMVHKKHEKPSNTRRDKETSDKSLKKKSKHSKKKTPTAHALFRQRYRNKFKTFGERMLAWNALSEAERKAYDDKAAALRVAAQK